MRRINLGDLLTGLATAGIAAWCAARIIVPGIAAQVPDWALLVLISFFIAGQMLRIRSAKLALDREDAAFHAKLVEMLRHRGGKLAHKE